MAINLHKIGTVLPMTKECEYAIIISSNSGLGKKQSVSQSKKHKKTTTVLILIWCNKFVVVLLFENPHNNCLPTRVQTNFCDKESSHVIAKTKNSTLRYGRF